MVETLEYGLVPPETLFTLAHGTTTCLVVEP
jgi:hypothetical protein